MAKKVEIIVGLIDKTGPGAKSAKKGISSIGKIGAVAGAAVAAGAVVAVGAVAAIAVSGIKAAISMEEQMSGIAAIFSTTSDKIKPLGDLIKELGLNPNLKVNATEAADAIEMLGKNGLTMAEILDGAAESTVLLANSTGADFSIAANIGTDAMALFNIKAGDMIDAVDGITAVTVNSKFGINDYALALAQGGGVASAVGVSFEDFNATIAGISPLFRSGSDAGTSLKTMLLRLEPQTSKAADAMEELGLLTEAGTSAFFDAEGNMKSMADISGLMDDAFSDLSEQQRLSALQTIFGTDAMRAAVGMMELGEEGFESLVDTMGQTDAMAAAATRMDNVAGAMEIFEGIIETTKLSLGQALLPVIRMFIDNLIVLADTWLPAIETAFETFSTVLGSFFANMGEGMGFMNSFIEAMWDFVPPELAAKLMAIQDGINNMMTAIIEFITPIWKAITSFIGLGDALTALAIVAMALIIPAIIAMIAPFLVLIAIFAAVAAAVAALRWAWENNFGGIQEKTQAVMTFVSNLIQTVMTFIREFWAENGDAILAKAQEIWTTIQTVISTAITVISAIISVTIDAIQAFWAEHGAQILAIAQTIWAAILSAITTFITLVQNIIVAVATYLQGFWERHGEALLAGAKKAWEHIKNIISLALDYIQTIFTTFAALFRGDWAAFGEGILELWRLTIQMIVEVISGLWALISPILAGLWADFKGWFSKQDWKSLGRSIIDGIKAGVMNAAGSLAAAAAKAVRDALQAAKDAIGFGSPAKAFIPLGMSMPQGLTVGVAQGSRALNDAVSRMATGTITTTQQTTNNYYLTAKYGNQSPGSLAQDVRLMEMLAAV